MKDWQDNNTPFYYKGKQDGVEGKPLNAKKHNQQWHVFAWGGRLGWLGETEDKWHRVAKLMTFAKAFEWVNQSKASTIPYPKYRIDGPDFSQEIDNGFRAASGSYRNK